MMYFVFQPWTIGPTGDVYAVGWTVENKYGNQVEDGLLVWDVKLANLNEEDHTWIQKNYGEYLYPNLQGSNDPQALYEALCMKFWEAWVSVKMHGAEMFCWNSWPGASKFIWDCAIEYSFEDWTDKIPETIHSVKSMWWAAEKWCEEDISQYVNGFPTQGNPHQQAKEIARSLFTCLHL